MLQICSRRQSLCIVMIVVTADCQAESGCFAQVDDPDVWLVQVLQSRQTGEECCAWRRVSACGAGGAGDSQTGPR